MKLLAVTAVVPWYGSGSADVVEAFTNLIGSSTVVLLALKMARRWIRAEVKWEMSAYSFDRYERGRDAAAQLLH